MEDTSTYHAVLAAELLAFSDGPGGEATMPPMPWAVELAQIHATIALALAIRDVAAS